MQYAGLDQTQRTSLQVGGVAPTLYTYDGPGIGPSSSRPQTAVNLLNVFPPISGGGINVPANPSFFTRTPGGALVSQRRGGNSYFYITDRLGSVRALASAGARGVGSAVVNRYQYDPWGAISAQSEAVPQPFKFAGAEYDTRTGLYKMGARYYDPAIGRFTQTDLLGGVYPYVFNNPVNLIDPDGLQPSSPESGPTLPGLGSSAGLGIPSGILIAVAKAARAAVIAELPAASIFGTGTGALTGTLLTAAGAGGAVIAGVIYLVYKSGLGESIGDSLGEAEVKKNCFASCIGSKSEQEAGKGCRQLCYGHQ
jgi:RHS repeat-associated protein